jgi:mxaJ protein
VYSVYSVYSVACLLAAAVLCGCQRAPARTIRVCADPNNLPYSNVKGEGFENKIAELLAADRHAGLDYTWWAQRRGFVRNTLKAGTCDILIGVPREYDMATTTKPYYRSTYVFVTRQDRHLRLASFDDPRLRTLRVGVQMIGDDFHNTPPAHALTRRGVIDNVVGYPVYGDYALPAPLSPIVKAVDHGDVDAAVVWGPQAAFFSRTSTQPLALTPVFPQRDAPDTPFVFDISMGVKKGNTALRDELDDFLARRHADIDRILTAYGVPRVGGGL